MELYGDLRERYLGFADEAVDSPCFRAWALAVADDPEVRELLETIEPEVKQQPNLVFAAARWHGVEAPAPYPVFREHLLAQWAAIRATIAERFTQTNEVGRLATLLPVLAGFDEPLSLVELGASAGLCLYPDRYRYVYRPDDGPSEGVVVVGDGPALPCRVRGPAPLPVTPPRVDTRCGLDLHPRDVTDPEQMAWLETLVWPEHADRRIRFRTAVEVARADPPDLYRGDLTVDLPGLLDTLPTDRTPVVFHSAVVAYVPPRQRDGFAEQMLALVAAGRCHWVSNEGPTAVPALTATVPAGRTAGPDTNFVLGVDGQAVAFTHGHGAVLDWFGPDAAR